jgi:1-acyl-sn-glycerol-3-phosphate acyltransferase
MPKQGPVIGLAAHFSLLDTVALLYVDPYHPLSTLVIKESLMRVPVLRTILAAWGVIPVERQGRDVSALRDIVDVVIRQHRTVCIAPEGARSRTGHLGPMHPVLMRLVADLACKGVPVVPLVVIGAYEALPPGAWLPRPRRMRVVLGDPMDFSRWCGKRVREAELEEIGRFVQDTLAAMLPPERRPAPGTPAVRSLGGSREDSERPALAANESRSP